MTHPRMYEEDDSLLALIRSVCLSYPESREVEAWGRATFRAGTKIFAVYSTDEEHEHSLVFKPEPGEREALGQDSRMYVPPYFGAAGWLALDLVATAPDWQEVAELAEASYRQIALKRTLAVLDDR